MEDALQILRCPHSKGSLRRLAEGKLVSEDGKYEYPLTDGIARFLPEMADTRHVSATDDPGRNVREYYETKGWETDEKGGYGDTRAFVDTRTASLDFTHRCMRRLNKYFQTGGRYILDAGSGPIPHDEYLEYGARYARRVCVDLSVGALGIAKSKLGDKGIYLQGDLTNIPLKDGSVDAVTCNHVIYHVPADRQAAAFLELWRVLRSGGVAVVVYAWEWSPIAWRLRRLGRLVRGDKDSDEAEGPDLYFHPHSLDWFSSQKWPFRYRIDTFRIVDNGFMRRYIGDGWIGRAILQGFYALQLLFPGFCGKYGAYPAIVIYKD